MPLSDLPVGARSLNLDGYAFAPGTYYFYVKMQSKPGLLNHTSRAVKYVVQDSNSND